MKSLMLSPDSLRRYLFPRLEEISMMTHDAGMPLIMHSDGKLTAVLDDLVALGLDALHPIQPKAMDIRELNRTYGDRLALFGNVDLNLLGRGTVEETREAVRSLIRDLAPGGGYALRSGCSISNYVKPENCRAVLEAAFEYGRCPIDCWE